MPADENIRIALNGLIVDAVAIGYVTCEDAEFKAAIHKTGIHAHNNERLRRWVAIAAHPVGIHLTDWPRQAVCRSVETDRPRLTVVAGKDAEVKLVLDRAGANARASDVFTLLKCDGEWKITHKLFHWHDR